MAADGYSMDVDRVTSATGGLSTDGTALSAVSTQLATLSPMRNNIISGVTIANELEQVTFAWQEVFKELGIEMTSLCANVYTTKTTYVEVEEAVGQYNDTIGK